MDPRAFETGPEQRLARGDRVRLLHETHGLPPGSVGVVLGFYAREHRTIVVGFDSEIVEVEPSALESIDIPG